MTRYLVERSFADRFCLQADPTNPALATVAENNAAHGVHWVHSFVAADRSKTFCIYDAPSPEAIRSSARANGLPVDRITEVRVLDPAFYVSPEPGAAGRRSGTRP